MYAGKKQAKASRSSTTTEVKKRHKEREYEIDDLKKMTAQVLSGEMPSARAAALAAGLPHAERSLNRYLKRVRENTSLQCVSHTDTKVAQLQHASELEFAEKGNPDICGRRLFSEDELEYFARALKLYADMGWPLDYQQIRHMFSHAAARMKRVHWEAGHAYVCSTTYVADFVNSRDELKAFKASHVDPLRAKKATSQVSRNLA